MTDPSPQVNKSTCFVTTLDLKLADKLREGLQSQGFTFSQPQYTIFSAKKKGLSCTLFASGKLLVQGKEMAHFIEFFLEPEILGDVSYTNRHLLVDKTGRIGVDESGKGDFFGPLCVAGVYASGEEVVKLMQMGIKDSKTLSDTIIRKLAKTITEEFPHAIIRINPKRYNELYKQFRNLNSLLAWGHATVIETLAQKTGCKKAIIDQFAAKHVVQTALKRKNMQIDLSQQHRAESDPIVAAASILARAAFLQGLETLGESIGTILPKGASGKTVEVAKKIVSSNGREVLSDLCKMHFKTYRIVLGEESEGTSGWDVLDEEEELP